MKDFFHDTPSPVAPSIKAYNRSVLYKYPRIFQKKREVLVIFEFSRCG